MTDRNYVGSIVYYPDLPSARNPEWRYYNGGELKDHAVYLSILIQKYPQAKVHSASEHARIWQASGKITGMTQEDAELIADAHQELYNEH